MKSSSSLPTRVRICLAASYDRDCCPAMPGIPPVAAESLANASAMDRRRGFYKIAEMFGAPGTPEVRLPSA